MRPTDYFRETFAGRTINLVSRGRLLSPPDPQLPQKEQPAVILSRENTLNRTISRPYADPDAATEAEILEKGASAFLVDWYGDDDPENPQNWLMAAKLCSSGIVDLLTFSIYIGSAIYTAGIEGVDA
jgi:MFS transporter, DHA1 family, multidrug resistance protein